jgi:hypothetical protein
MAPNQSGVELQHVEQLYLQTPRFDGCNILNTVERIDRWDFRIEWRTLRYPMWETADSRRLILPYHKEEPGYTGLRGNI